MHKRWTAVVALGAMAFILACNDKQVPDRAAVRLHRPGQLLQQRRRRAGRDQRRVRRLHQQHRRQLLRPQLRHDRRAHDGDVDVAPRRDERAHAAGRVRDSRQPRLRPVDLGVGVRRDQSRELRARSRAGDHDGHGAPQPNRRRGEVPARHALLQSRASVRRRSAQAARDAGSRQPRDPAQHGAGGLRADRARI